MKPNDVVSDRTVRIAVTGSSGSGKSTILKKILQSGDISANIRFSVSHTTRKPRLGELDGKDYHFVSLDVFNKMIENQEFLEYATYNGNLYGTSLNELSGLGKVVPDRKNTEAFCSPNSKRSDQLNDKDNTNSYIQSNSPSVDQTKDSIDQERPISENPEVLVLDLERKGIEALKKGKLDFKFVYVFCDKKEIFRRLIDRLKRTRLDLKDLEDIEKRIGEFDKDLESFESTHYDLVIRNYDLANSVAAFKNFLLSHISRIK